ncbi:uncharacterized protein LOC143022965 [Oratosquilla oratoria]|uniref:uncharacterized protein LOC143022965 n=1 Tax=Oratosquilla oratoria TaxID=337810 RepID=UPI003F7696E2
MADVKTPILGADFIARYRLLLYVANSCLVCATASTSTPLQIEGQPTTVTAIDARMPYAHLFTEFPDVFKPELRQTPQTPVKNGVYHYIKTSGPPVFVKYRRLQLERLSVAKKTLQEMERLGATFLRLIDGILGILYFCVCYVDDILVFSNSSDQHLQYLRTIFDRLQDNGLVVRFDKSSFGKKSVISPDGVRPL